ncbi:uncharacterized protein [Fopius arisanus]|uniref:Double jelly roll-like domain-containing protein n=1 Tax=Fopius arisanus TaxID=64838 RepID=A0A9R1U5Y4_9HYME|nr:PREDICTED: uncharacterized protein LOC105269625 [Fopius arisanus]
MLPYIKPADTQKVLLNQISKDTEVPISFRSWELYEYPLLPSTTKHVSTVKCSTQLKRPRYVILGFKIARNNQGLKDASAFDHCNVPEIKLFLNSQSYPYGNVNFDIAHNQSALLYDMHTSFQASYYHKEPEPLLSRADFLKTAPPIVIDCCKQNEFLKSGAVVIRQEFQSSEIFYPNKKRLLL